MEREIIIDTVGFYSMLVTRDRMHLRTREFMAQAVHERRRFVTTDHVLGDTATLLRARGFNRLAPLLFESVETSSSIRIGWTTPARFREVKAFFLRRADKAWSFTDCLSFVVMRELGLREALSTDDHFRQAGFALVLDNPQEQLHDSPAQYNAEPDQAELPQSSNLT